MNNLTLLIGNGSTFYDVSELITKVTTSGQRTKAPRTLTADLYDSELLKMRCPVDVGEGQTVVLYENGYELFQGLLMSEDKKSSKRVLSIKAYDICVRFTNNKDSFSYKNYRADQIFKDCCSRLGLTVGYVANTGHVIGELIKKATTYWDVMEDALSQTYKTTGERYYIYAYAGKVHLIHRTAQETMPIIELDTNVISYDRTRSIENTRTRLKIVTSEGTLKNSTVLSDLEKKIGVFQEYESVNEKITATEIKQRVNAFKKEKGLVNQSLKVQGTGDSSVISGGCVFVKIPNIDAKRIMYVEEDQHVWEKGVHTMTLKLDYAKVTTESAAASSSSTKNIKKTYKVGDVVNFKGGYHYESSYSYAKGYKVSAGPAKIYKDPNCTGNGKAHPWCLITTDWSKTHVYGWVDEGTFE